MLGITINSMSGLLNKSPVALQKGFRGFYSSKVFCNFCSSDKDFLLRRALEGFIDLKDEDKLKKLTEYAAEVYESGGLGKQPTVEKAELAYQKYLLGLERLPLYPSEISEDKTTAYWHNYHKVKAPYRQGSTDLKHEDKELALDMFFQLRDEGRIRIDEEVVLLIVNGCDNNEAGVKMRLQLEEVGVKTQVVATDVSLDALSKSRGLEHLVVKRIPQISESSTVLHDFFLEGSGINIDSEHQKIALPFRLTAIAPKDKVKETVKKVVSGSDICILHFLEDKELTQKTLKRQRFGTQKKTLEIDDLEVSYYESKKGHTICVWDEKKVAQIVGLSGGSVVDMKTIETHDDENHSINMIVVVVENQKAKEKKND